MQFPGDGGVGVGFVALRDKVSRNRLSAGGKAFYHANVKVAVNGERKALRNRRGAHHQKMRRNVEALSCRRAAIRVRNGNRPALFHDRLPLHHAKAVLLVDDNQLQVLVNRRSAEQSVRSDQNVYLAVFERL